MYVYMYIFNYVYILDDVTRDVTIAKIKEWIMKLVNFLNLLK